MSRPMPDQKRQAGAVEREEIEVTPEMIEAGVAELREKCFGQSLDRVVKDVFWVMVAARHL